MNLVKTEWSEKYVKEYREYLLSFKGNEKQIEFEKRIANTNFPCIAVPSKTINEIVKEISKGDFQGFLDLKILEYHTDFIIYGKLVCKIKDFDKRKRLLKEFSEIADSWSHTDCLYLKAKRQEEKEYFNFAKELLKSPYVFSRRLSYIIMLKNINEHTINDILKFCMENRNENEYYVNMAVSWLISECFIKFREKTLDCLAGKMFNDFVIKKSIRKCLDSYRVSDCDKALLKNLKEKIKKTD